MKNFSVELDKFDSSDDLRYFGAATCYFFHVWFWLSRVRNPHVVNQINTSRGYFRVIVGLLDCGIATRKPV